MTYDEFLPYEVRSAIVLHMDTSVREVCGVIVQTKDGYKYEECENVHPEKEEGDFVRFDAKTSARIQSKKSNVVAYVHTHPNGPTCPTKPDMETQMKVGKPSVICARNPQTGIVELFSFGDHLLDYPLAGRDFKPSVFDCYEFGRSWLWQKEGFYMPPMPRDPYWYNQGKKYAENGEFLGYDREELDQNPNLYLDNFQRLGWREYTPDFGNVTSIDHPKVGDTILMQLDAPVINHCAIYIGNNQIAHHRINKKSGTSPLGYLLGNGYVRKWLRREGKDSE